MKIIFKKHVIGLILLIFLAVLVLVGIFFFYSSMNQKIVRVLEIKERIASYEKNKSESAKEVAQLKTFENKLSTLESYVVTSSTVPSLLSTFETLAQDKGIVFEIAGVQTPTVNEKLKLLVEFNIRNGSLSQIQSFLSEIQHQAFQINFVKLSILSDPTPQPQTQPQTPAPTVISPDTPIIPKVPVAPRERNWQAVGIIEILSF